MANKSENTAALEARIAQLEHALSALTGSNSDSTNRALPSMQCHLELLLGSTEPGDINASLRLLSEQLDIQPLTLWSVDSDLNHWQLIAGELAAPTPPNPSAYREQLSNGEDLAIEDGLFAPIKVRGQTLAILRLPSAPAPALLSFAKHVATLIQETYQRGQLINHLNERDKRFRYAMRASRDGLWDWNLEQNTLYFSRGYLRMLDFEPDSLPGTFETFKNQVIHPEDVDNVLQEFNTAIDNRRESLCLEYRLRKRSGETVWVNSQCLLVEPDQQGKATRCVGTNSDITQSITDRQALIQAKAEAEMASQTKSKFLASMSHEIRTPLNAILGLGHLLTDTQLESQQESYLSSINHAANSLLHTVNQVFDYAKLDTGHIILENSHFDLEHVFERLSRMFESAAVHKPVNIIFDIADDVPRFLRGDAVRLGHIISHLVTNALQYSNSDQVIVKTQNMNASSDKIDLRFSIIDHGTGLDATTLKTLRDDLNTQPHSGTQGKHGFGLQICKLLVTLMHGKIDISSKLGKGSNFSFHAQFEHSHIGDHHIAGEKSSCRALRLLVIDDNQLALDILAKSAGKLVDHVDTASSAQEALEKIKLAEANHHAYDLLLLDYKMPLKNGLEAARDIYHAPFIHHKPKIFLVSSFQRDEIFSQHKDTDFVDDFLSKPVSESRLFDAICRAIPECLSDLNEEPSVTDTRAHLEGKRVLLVEDNTVNQQVARGMMKKQGIDVTCVENGQLAVDILQNATPFDAVLMDIEMPILDGIEATRVIRKLDHCKKLPIIAVTAQAMNGDRERCIEAGMNDYISKPIKPQLLYQTLSDLLNGQISTVKH
ncbi:response regulator [Gilvimarinus agarilyticus]|uniref:response regulator n=1 Tax=unclassified Gilvimarinus TaxID=2642066 RepID=UPI001C09DA37|nr:MULTISPECIES: response regulator [unclassified Gilvimarinus]MBU2885535.1 response regulator [Gilvimarinus agarilyticus]MDO6570434.1 response regulator [Gilvimarinus sp. 2_MG-2023]MDO6748384.1 response regulator [Gilvimarinus sp. 1_MG-2023]